MRLSGHQEELCLNRGYNRVASSLVEGRLEAVIQNEAVWVGLNLMPG